ncbi:hypothetical protein EYZ11_002472 [Aspergillus tanneri]|uniref:RRM domain-containing protein n=1 Tax=Aspergillus tanneri TaxID=1220188 RepID=A0A4S3JQT6_9EURO|nr:hypothetical protein EYZ11_002472 [Aspergillus tanneri]
MTNQVSPDSANSSFSPVPHYHLVPFIPQFPHYLKVSQYSMPLTPLTNENAQDFLPREARIFVGNLPVWLEHDEMVQSLRDIFSRFGPCYIKFREHMSKPSAFVQFPEEYQAGEAIQHNRQIFLEGRPLRIEPANGRATVNANVNANANASANASASAGTDAGAGL